MPDRTSDQTPALQLDSTLLITAPLLDTPPPTSIRRTTPHRVPPYLDPEIGTFAKARTVFSCPATSFSQSNPSNKYLATTPNGLLASTMAKALLLLFLCPASFLLAQNIQHINPPELSNSPAYTQAVTAKPGTIIWISGQTAQNAKGELVGKGDLKTQVNQAWENVRLALAGSGATFQDVVKVTTYVVNYKPSMRDDLRAARLKFMGDGKPPAATLVGVQSLASEDWLVEIEVTAVIR